MFCCDACGLFGHRLVSSVRLWCFVIALTVGLCFTVGAYFCCGLLFAIDCLFACFWLVLL